MTQSHCPASKYQFGMAHLEYLGHIVGGGQLAIPEYGIENIKKYKIPVTQIDVCLFLGIWYFQQLVQNFADT